MYFEFHFEYKVMSSCSQPADGARVLQMNDSKLLTAILIILLLSAKQITKFLLNIHRKTYQEQGKSTRASTVH